MGESVCDVVGLIWCIALIIVEFYLSVWPLHEKTSAKNFFANFIGVVAVFVIWAGAIIWYRCPVWVDARDANLDGNRRSYAERADEEAVFIKKGFVRALKVLFE